MKRSRVLVLVLCLIAVLASSGLLAAPIACPSPTVGWKYICYGRAELVNAWQPSGPASRAHMLVRNNQWSEDELTWGFPSDITYGSGWNPSAVDLSYQWFVIRLRNNRYLFKSIWGDPAYQTLHGSNYFGDSSYPMSQQSYSFYLVTIPAESVWALNWQSGIDHPTNFYLGIAYLTPTEEYNMLNGVDGASFPQEFQFALGPSELLAGQYYRTIRGSHSSDTSYTGAINMMWKWNENTGVGISDTFYGGGDSGWYSEYHTLGGAHVHLNFEPLSTAATWWSARWQIQWYSED